MKSAPTLVLFTQSYPYHRAAEQTFLDPEIRHLSRAFARVVLVPAALGGDRSWLGDGVEVDESLAALPLPRSRSQLLAAAATPSLARELVARPLAITNPVAFKRAVAFLAHARSMRAWLGGFLSGRRIDTRDTVFYTYWLDLRTMGLAFAKKSDRWLTLVSRAHGADLYEERQSPPYLPCRAPLLRTVDRLYLVSEHGRDYLARHYPAAAPRLRVSRLGVVDPRARTEPSRDHVFRVVSCAYVVEVKRLDRLAEGLALAARKRPDQRFEWTHIGGGPLRAELEARTARVAPTNLRSRFLGDVTNTDVLAFYRGQPVDAFANTSDSEGLPVSIMEAQSHGIPVMAPRVGGVPEVVDDDNGVLMPASPTPEHVADAILRLLDDQPGLARRRAARSRWEATCQAERNFAAFAADLRALLP